MIIYSKALEDKLSKVKFASILEIYRHCIKNANLENIFESVVWKQASTPEMAYKEIEEQSNYYIIGKQLEYPFYYFNSIARNDHYSRIYMAAPDEDTLLKIFTDKILVLI
jgi:hypothetical protein